MWPTKERATYLVALAQLSEHVLGVLVRLPQNLPVRGHVALQKVDVHVAAAEAVVEHHAREEVVGRVGHEDDQHVVVAPGAHGLESLEVARHLAVGDLAGAGQALGAAGAEGDHQHGVAVDGADELGLLAEHLLDAVVGAFLAQRLHQREVAVEREALAVDGLGVDVGEAQVLDVGDHAVGADLVVHDDQAAVGRPQLVDQRVLIVDVPVGVQQRVAVDEAGGDDVEVVELGVLQVGADDHACGRAGGTATALVPLVSSFWKMYSMRRFSVAAP
ncbi:peptidoglycan-binding protein [Babesia caballi]|uniref:Peptidoglycan-binding protein n=1 Tax=Babesia caballi TaxID=5871 RepID=A0AAV4LYK2_BABCB|nr:peptidoglycan-binding protein [Babesia caballi]